MIKSFARFYFDLKFQERVFNEEISFQVYKERYRCSPNVVDRLEEMIGEEIKHPTRRNRPLTPRQQVKICHLRFSFVSWFSQSWKCELLKTVWGLFCR